MPVNKRVMRKVAPAKTIKRRIAKSHTKKTANLLQVDQLGVDAQQIVTPAAASIAAESRQPPVIADSGPPRNLPIEPIAKVALDRKTVLHRSYTSPRTSFWLGVGFGVLVVGTLMLIAWQLAKVELVSAIVSGSGIPQ